MNSTLTIITYTSQGLGQTLAFQVVSTREQLGWWHEPISCVKLASCPVIFRWTHRTALIWFDESSLSGHLPRQCLWHRRRCRYTGYINLGGSLGWRGLVWSMAATYITFQFHKQIALINHIDETFAECTCLTLWPLIMLWPRFHSRSAQAYHRQATDSNVQAESFEREWLCVTIHGIW